MYETHQSRWRRALDSQRFTKLFRSVHSSISFSFPFSLYLLLFLKAFAVYKFLIMSRRNWILQVPQIFFAPITLHVTRPSSLSDQPSYFFLSFSLSLSLGLSRLFTLSFFFSALFQTFVIRDIEKCRVLVWPKQCQANVNLYLYSHDCEERRKFRIFVNLPWIVYSWQNNRLKEQIKRIKYRFISFF